MSTKDNVSASSENPSGSSPAARPASVGHSPTCLSADTARLCLRAIPLSIANDTLYGLCSGVWTRNGTRAYRMGRGERP